MSETKNNFLSDGKTHRFVNSIKNACIFLSESSKELSVFVISVYVFFSFITSTSFGINSGLFSVVLKIVKLFSYAFFGFLLIEKFTKYKSIKEALKCNLTGIIYLVIGFLIFLSSGSTNFIFLIAVFMSIDKRCISRAVNATFFTVLISYFSVILMNLIGIVDNVTITRAEKIRYSLGMDYPTVTIGIFYSLVLLYCYMKKSKAELYKLIIIEVIAIVLYIVTDGRMGIILITLAVAGMCFGKNRKVKEKCKVILANKKIKNILYYLPFIFAAIMIILTLIYSKNNVPVKMLDGLLSGRLKYGKYTFLKYPVTLFGQRIKWAGWAENIGTKFQYLYVDCSYVRILFDYGIIGLISMLVLYSKLIRYEIINKKYWLLFITVNILIWSVVEPYIFNLWRNTTILIMANVFCDGKGEGLKKRENT